MLIKTMSHGTGSCQAAADYLLQEKDAKGVVRADISVLRGDMQSVAELADILTFKNKYVSQVIAFHPLDEPSDQEISDVIDAWEAMAFAGLGSDQYTFCAVLHAEDDGSKHVHLITPRVELKSGNSMNIAPRNPFAFNAVANLLNEQKGWRSPDSNSPNYSYQRSLNRGQPDWDKNRAQVRMEVLGIIDDAIALGDIVKQQDIVDMLNAFEGLEVIKASKGFLTIQTSEMKKGMRLKDPTCRRDYDYRNHTKLEEAAPAKAGRLPIPDGQRLGYLQQQVEDYARGRIEYNTSRFSEQHEILTSAFTIDAEGIVEASTAGRERHAGSIAVQSEKDALAMVEARHDPDADSLDFDDGDDVPQSRFNHPQRHRYHNSRKWEEVASVQSGSSDKIRTTSLSTYTGVIHHETIFERGSQYVKQCIRKAVRAMQQAVQCFGRTSAGINQADADIQSACSRAGSRTRKLQHINEALTHTIRAAELKHSYNIKVEPQFKQDIENDNDMSLGG